MQNCFRVFKELVFFDLQIPDSSFPAGFRVTQKSARMLYVTSEKPCSPLSFSTSACIRFRLFRVGKEAISCLVT